jgi:hypothetical protein
MKKNNFIALVILFISSFISILMFLGCGGGGGGGSTSSSPTATGTVSPSPNVSGSPISSLRVYGKVTSLPCANKVGLFT